MEHVGGVQSLRRVARSEEEAQCSTDCANEGARGGAAAGRERAHSVQSIAASVCAPKPAFNHTEVVAAQRRSVDQLAKRGRFANFQSGAAVECEGESAGKGAAAESNCGDATACVPRKKKRRTSARGRQREYVLVATSLSAAELNAVLCAIATLNAAGLECVLEKEFSASTTHVLASYGVARNAASGCPPLRCVRTLKFLQGIAKGLWIVSPEWVVESARHRTWVQSIPYEIKAHLPSAASSGTAAAHATDGCDKAIYATRRARMRRARGEAALFHGVRVRIAGRFKQKGMRGVVRSLVELAGGSVLRGTHSVDEENGVVVIRGDAAAIANGIGGYGATSALQQRDTGSTTVSVEWLIQSISGGRVLPC